MTSSYPLAHYDFHFTQKQSILSTLHQLSSHDSIPQEWIGDNIRDTEDNEAWKTNFSICMSPPLQQDLPFPSLLFFFSGREGLVMGEQGRTTLGLRTAKSEIKMINLLLY